MRLLLWKVALATLVTLLPLNAHAQMIPAFEQPFQYTDRNGPGTLTITPVYEAGIGMGFQSIQATLERGGQRFSGAGVYIRLTTEELGIQPPPVLLAFTLLDTQGRSFFFEGHVSETATGFTGQGTYFPVTAPRTVTAWRIESQRQQREPIVSSRPTLRGGWLQYAFAEAIGGTYFATFNRQTGVTSTATWTGTLPSAGRYRLEVFIPRQRQGFTPRTERATYRLGGADPQAQALPRISQNVATSQWVDLGVYSFGTTFEVTLTDETGEPALSRSVVANAIRLTPAGATGGTPNPGGL
jgi:hypothetical protein